MILFLLWLLYPSWPSLFLYPAPDHARKKKSSYCINQTFGVSLFGISFDLLAAMSLSTHSCYVMGVFDLAAACTGSIFLAAVFITGMSLLGTMAQLRAKYNEPAAAE